MTNETALPLGAVVWIDTPGGDFGKVLDMRTHNGKVDYLIEHPRQPDPSRHHGASKDGIGLWWKVIGRNKRLATLDLSTPDGQQLFRRIAKESIPTST